MTRTQPIRATRAGLVVAGLATLAPGWTLTGNMDISRSQHTARLLSDGNVLVAGGDGTAASAELYDPGTRTWTATAE